MTCRDYQHQISLFLYEELSEAEKSGLEAHLQACDACRLAFEEEKGMNAVLSEDAIAFDIPSDLLLESRRELANQLDRVEKQRSWWRLPTFSVVFTPMRLLESGALIAMGLALGVYVSNQQYAARELASNTPQQESSIASAIPANGSVSNLRIVSANPSTGQVELAGEIVQPLRMRGQLSDETVQQLLVNALGDATNSGSRLRAVEVLAQQADQETVKRALMQALMYDDNAGVRLRAMQGLKQFAGQADVQAAFIQSLQNDADAGIRNEAIEALTRNPGVAGTRLAKALEPFTRDDNTYVKMKALQFVGTHK
jgi:Putative zinc-finger/HEAT repeats